MCHISVSVAVAGDVHRHTIGGTVPSSAVGRQGKTWTEDVTEWTDPKIIEVAKLMKTDRH